MASSKLAGKRILIIGGSSGIGYAVAANVYSEGATVILTSANSDRLSAAATKLKQQQQTNSHKTGSIHTIACDLLDAADSEKLDANIASLFAQIPVVLDSSSGPYLDHIVFTAGRAPDFMPVDGVTLDAAQRSSLLRLWAPTLVAKHGKAYLGKGNENSITFTSGSAGQKTGGPGWTVTAGINAGVEGVVRALASELKPVRVNVVSPGAVATEMWSPLPEEQRNGIWQQLSQGLATGKIAQPKDVAEAYAYLMKDDGCSAATINTNGGLLVM